MAKKAAKKWTSAELIELLRTRHDQTKYAFLEQVPNATGYGCNSWVDAAVISLWPSEGLTRTAFEIKVTRGDFIRELKDPSKNAWARKYFHEFWFVMPSECIKDESEIPKGDGWLMPRGDKLVIKRQAQRGDASLDDELLCALARSLDNYRQTMEGTIRRNFHANDKAYQRAKAYEDAVERFLPERSVSVYYDGDAPKPDDVIAKLKEATMDKTLRDEQKLLHEQAAKFQDCVLDAFDLLLVLGHGSMFERDDKGDLKLGHWGYPDTKAKRELLGYGRTRLKERSAKIAALLDFIRRLDDG